jgi:hypothetical protein
MRKYLAILGVAALAAPLTALAVEPASPQVGTSPAQMCKEERRAMGPDAFKAKYGTRTKSNAYGKCVAKLARER